MAKIVTITNPLTGQPAQVDQLDHTAQQIDDGLDIARGVSNPNLLDNWYFGNPVDQRGGYVAIPGCVYYDTWGGPSTGTTDTYYTAIHTPGGYDDQYQITVNGAVKYVNEIDCIRGYTGAGYTIDRWKIDGTSYMTIGDNKITFGNTNADYSAFKQIIENPSQYIGKTLTFSVLGRAISGSPSTFIPYHGTAPLKNELSVVSQTFVYGSASGEDTSNLQVNVWGNNTVSSVELIAAKLELGTQQTLAHQENGVWVLNEIPNYADMLARCQYYSDLPTTWAPMTFYVADFIVFTVKTHREMRVNLSSANVTLDSSKLEVHSNGAAQSGFTFSVYGGGDDFILVKAAKSGHGLSNAMLIVNNGGVYANANM